MTPTELRCLSLRCDRVLLRERNRVAREGSKRLLVWAWVLAVLNASLVLASRYATHSL